MICVCLNCNNVYEWITVVCVGRSFPARLPKKMTNIVYWLTRRIVNSCKLLAKQQCFGVKLCFSNLWLAELALALDCLLCECHSQTWLFFFFLPPPSMVIYAKSTSLVVFDVDTHGYVIQSPPPPLDKIEQKEGDRSFQKETFSASQIRQKRKKNKTLLLSLEWMSENPLDCAYETILVLPHFVSLDWLSGHCRHLHFMGGSCKDVP